MNVSDKLLLTVYDFNHGQLDAITGREIDSPIHNSQFVWPNLAHQCYSSQVEMETFFFSHSTVLFYRFHNR
jgi:hypothetical protein